MYRRWQKDAVDRYRTLESLNTFLGRLTPLKGPNILKACDAADLYAVLSTLHSKDRNPQLHCNENPGFYYFLADAEQPEGASGAVEAQQQQQTEATALAADAGADAGGGKAYSSVRREAVVPVSSKSTTMTTDMLSCFFQLEAHPNVGHILLAIVDNDGSVSLVRIFNYLQPPFEGPEALPPLEGEAAAGADSDDG